MSQTFANNLKYYRGLADLTQENLARFAGITRSAVNNYETRKSEPNFDVLCRIASVLGVDITDLLVDHDDRPQYARRALVTDEELRLLDLYRTADPVYRRVAVEMLALHQEVPDGQKSK